MDCNYRALFKSFGTFIPPRTACHRWFRGLTPRGQKWNLCLLTAQRNCLHHEVYFFILFTGKLLIFSETPSASFQLT